MRRRPEKAATKSSHNLPRNIVFDLENAQMFEVPIHTCTYCNIGKTTNLFICGACCARLDDALDEVTNIEQELPYIINGTTKVRIDGPSVTCSKVNATDVLNIAAMDAEVNLNNALVAFAKRIEDDPTSAQLTWLFKADGTHIKDASGNNAYTLISPVIPNNSSMATLANWSRNYIEWLAGEESAADDMTFLMNAINRARRFVTKPVERATFGKCNTPVLLDVEGAVCTYELSTVLGAETIHCKACGASWTVAERVREMMAGALDQKGTAAKIAKALTLKKIKGVHTKRIIDFKRDGFIERVGALPYHVVSSHGQVIEREHDLFRLGDVLDEVIRRQNKKAAASARKASREARKTAHSLAA
jgi:hypothetical protein